MGNRKPGKSEAGKGVPPEDAKFSLISDGKLIDLYKNLLRSRKTLPNRHKGSPRIEDAAVVGTAIDLGPGDAVCSLDHHHFASLSRADAIELMLGSARNGKPQTSRGKNGVSPSSAHAVIGSALANKTAKNQNVVLVYCAGARADCLREAIHIATLHALPIVFVRQANRAGHNVNADKGAKSNWKFAEPTPWFPSITVDTHDVVALYRVANESISRARLGRGPTLIECRAYPLGRTQNGTEKHAHDPVLKMEHYLRAKGLFDPKLKRSGGAEFKDA